MSDPNANPLDGLLFCRSSAIVYLLDRCLGSGASAVAIDGSVSRSHNGILKIVDNGTTIQSTHVSQIITFCLQPLINLGLLAGCLFLTQSEKETAVILFDPRLTESQTGYCTVLFDRFSEPANSNAFSLRPGADNLTALEAITRLSPFNSIRDLLNVLRSYSSTGTQTILYGMSTDFLRIEPSDIIFNHESISRPSVSCAQMLSVLYWEPVARFFLRGAEVKPRNLLQEIRAHHIKYVFDHRPEFTARPLTVTVGKVTPESNPGAQGEWFTPRAGVFPVFRAIYVYVEDKLSSIGPLPDNEMFGDLMTVVSSPSLQNSRVLSEMVLMSLEEYSWRTGAKGSLNESPISLDSVTVPSSSSSTTPAPTTIRMTQDNFQALWIHLFDQSAPTTTSHTISSPSASKPAKKQKSTERKKKKENVNNSSVNTTQEEEEESGFDPKSFKSVSKPKRQVRKFMEPDEEYNCCQDWTNTGLQIQCDKCLLWQHGLCTGFATQEEVPEPYYCDKCLVAMGVDFAGPDNQGHGLKLRNSRCSDNLRKICQYLLFYASSFEDLSEFVFTTEEQWNEWMTNWENAMEKVRELPQVVDLLLDLETRLAAKLFIPEWKPRREIWLRELRKIQSSSVKAPSKAKHSALLHDLFKLVTEFPTFINDAAEMADPRKKPRKRKQ